MKPLGIACLIPSVRRLYTLQSAAKAAGLSVRQFRRHLEDIGINLKHGVKAFIPAQAVEQIRTRRGK